MQPLSALWCITADIPPFGDRVFMLHISNRIDRLLRASDISNLLGFPISFPFCLCERSARLSQPGFLLRPESIMQNPAYRILQLVTVEVDVRRNTIIILHTHDHCVEQPDFVILFSPFDWPGNSLCLICQPLDLTLKRLITHMRFYYLFLPFTVYPDFETKEL